MSILNIMQLLPTNIRKVLVIQCLTSIGHFLVIPFLVIYLVRYGNFSIQFATMQLSLFLIGQYSSTFVGGYMTDKIGAYFTMKSALLLQLVSYLVFSWLEPMAWMICILSFCIGISRGLFVPAVKSIIASHSNESNRILMFSLRSTVNNFGVAVGSGLGGLLIDFHHHIFFYVAFLAPLLALILVFRIDNVVQQNLVFIQKDVPQIETWKSIRLVFMNGSFLKLVLLYVAFNFLYIQVEGSFPLFASQKWGSWAVSLVFMTNAIVVILFQVVLNHILHQWMSSWGIMLAGFLSFALCFWGMSMVDDVVVFCLLVVCFTLGEMFIDPIIDALASQHIPQTMLGTAYGILGVIGLIGGILGNFFAGYLLGHHDRSATLLWEMCAGIAVISMFIIIFFNLRTERTKF